MRNLVCCAAVLAFVAALAAPRPAPAKTTGECLAQPDARLVVGNGDTIALRPGGSAKLSVTCRYCCWIDEPLRSPVTWSLQPPTTAATLDARTGALTVAAAAP